MPQPRPQAIDGLWQCLCPSFNQPILGQTLSRPRLRFSLPIRQATRSFPYSTELPYKHFTVTPSNNPKEPGFWIKKRKSIASDLSSDNLNSPWKRREVAKANVGEEAAKESQTNSSTKILRDSLARDIRTLPIAQIHDALQLDAECAYYERVHEIVGILIRERGESPDHRHYRALISAQANLEHGSAAEIERLLQEMEENSVELNSAICSAILKALAVHPHYMLRCHIIEEMQRSWFTLSMEDHQHIAAGLLKDLQFELAVERLQLMQAQGFTPSPWLYNLFLYTLSYIRAWPEVDKLLDEALATPDYRVPAALWLHLLHTATREHQQMLIRKVWNRSVKNGYVNPTSGLCTSILESCAAHGDTNLAADVFRVLSQRSSPLQTWHYESLLETYLVFGDIEGAISTIGIMNKAGFPLSSANSRPIYLALSDNPEMLSDALGIISSRNHLEHNPAPIALVNVILEVMLHRGELSTAVNMVENMDTLTSEAVDVTTFNTLLQGCAIAARKDVAMSLVQNMRKRGIMPNALTYDRLILACLSTEKKEDFEDAWRYYNELKTSVPLSNTKAAATWGIRRGTVKRLAETCIVFQDERAFDLLDQCTKEGMDISALRRDFYNAWEAKWGADSIPNIE